MAVCVEEKVCKGCSICTEFCPKDILVDSETINKHGYYPPLVKKQGECHGCRLCELLCPECQSSIQDGTCIHCGIKYGVGNYG